jgi:hypothetical protein
MPRRKKGKDTRPRKEQRPNSIYVGLDLDLALHEAIAKVPHFEGRDSVAGRVKYVLRYWLAERGTIVPEPIIKLGRPPDKKKATLPTEEPQTPKEKTMGAS